MFGPAPSALQARRRKARKRLHSTIRRPDAYWFSPMAVMSNTSARSQESERCCRKSSHQGAAQADRGAEIVDDRQRTDVQELRTQGDQQRAAEDDRVNAIFGRDL